jgi:hypothetical protein
MLVYPFKVHKTFLGYPENELREKQTLKMQVSWNTMNLVNTVLPWKFRSEAEARRSEPMQKKVASFRALVRLLKYAFVPLIEAQVYV